MLLLVQCQTLVADAANTRLPLLVITYFVVDLTSSNRPMKGISFM